MPRKGSHWTEEQKAKIRGKPHPWSSGDKNPMKNPETRAKISASLKGKMTWDVKGDNNPSKRPEVRKKISEAIRGKSHPWSIGDKNPMRRPEVLARFQGENNVSKRPEIREKISKALKGRVFSEETITRMSEAARRRPPFSEESKKKMSQSRKGRIFSPETRKKLSQAHKGRVRSKEHCQNISKAKTGVPIPARQGEKHPLWKGGTSFEPYPLTFNNCYKRKIRDRDGRTCVLCGNKENGKTLQVHHIDYDKKNMDPMSKASLCLNCHSWTTHHREAAQEILTRILHSKYYIVHTNST